MEDIRTLIIEIVVDVIVLCDCASDSMKEVNILLHSPLPHEIDTVVNCSHTYSVCLHSDKYIVHHYLIALWIT